MIETTTGEMLGMIQSPVYRGSIPGSDGLGLSARFRFGGSQSASPLASGLVRTQVCLIFNYKNTCNCVYACYRWGEDQHEGAGMIQVSTKINPGAFKHSECGAKGYTLIEPDWCGYVDRPSIAWEYEFRGQLSGRVLRVWLDDRFVWVGDIGADAAQLRGCAGFRTDNVKLTHLRFKTT